MLPSLGIRNYRNLKSLDIERLARVNLIAGKNNTGKTSLLEAVSLYASEGSLLWIDELLKYRGEFYAAESTLQNNLETYSSLFHQRKAGFLDEDRIVIGPLEDVRQEMETSKELQRSLNIRFIRKKKVSRSLVDSETHEPVAFEHKWLIAEGIDEITDEELRMGLSVSYERKNKILPMLDDLDRKNNLAYILLQKPGNLHFVRTYRADDSYLMWSNIALTEKEDHVIQALRIIDTDVEKLAFVEDDNQQKALIKIKDSKERHPLRSMGDGMNRILSIILALVNASDGYLLIDEFENGLHHTVQEDLWKMIFKLAKELNVQVFATTHSDDCIHAFERVLNSNGNQKEGQYLRLDNIEGQIIPTLYSEKELDTAADQRIEVR